MSPRRIFALAVMSILCSFLAACAVDTSEDEGLTSSELSGDDEGIAEDDDEDAPLPTDTLAADDLDSAVTPLAPLPRVSAVFTVPKNGQPDTGPESIEGKIIAMAEHATKGSKVRVAMFHWSRARVAKAFVRAAKNGADVRVVIDEDNKKNGQWNNAVQLLKDALGSKLTVCKRGKGSCIGTNINHNKIFLFSKLDNGATNVVAQASQNLTAPQTALHNNMVIAQDAALFDDYMHYFQDLVAQKEDLSYDGAGDGTGLHAFMSPRSDDKVVDILDNVKCTGDKPEIHIAMALFQNRMAVARRLAGLAGEGCNVHVVVRPRDKGTTPGVMKILKNGGPRLDLAIMPIGPGGNHSKYMLIDARYKGTRQKLVFTGSHNYTQGALHHNDEVLLRVDADSVYDAFLADWKIIHAAAK